MYKLLPIHEPMIASTSSLSVIFSILPEHPDYLKWVYSYFILLRHKAKLRLVYELTFKYKFNCPLLDYQLVNRNLFFNLGIDILEFIKTEINDDAYIHLWVDHTYLLNSSSEKPHNLFIYGYNDKEKILYIADHLINSGNKFVHTTCNYDEFREAFCKMNFEAPNIETFKISKNVFEIYLPIIKDQLILYLNGQSYFNLDSRMSSYGLKIYDVQIEILKRKSIDEKIDIKDLYFLYEHKQLMRLRINYLHEYNYIKTTKDDIDKLIEMCTEIEYLAKIVMNLSIKENLSHRLTNINKMIEYIKIIQEKEFVLITKFINLWL